MRRVVAAAIACAALLMIPIALPSPAMGGSSIGPVVKTAKNEISGYAVARASHRCSGGRVHAVLEGDHKCLGPGQYCAKRHQKKYKRKGLVCKNGRLKRR
jgi:hypothetical protein